MTVDSAYKPVEHANDGDTEYPFEIEGVGTEAMQIYVVDADGNATKLIQPE